MKLFLCLFSLLFIGWSDAFMFPFQSKSVDPYKALGLRKTKSLTKQQVLKAYRQQSLIYHPDKNKAEDAASKFHVMNEAKEKLLDIIETGGEKGFLSNLMNSYFENEQLFKLIGVACSVAGLYFVSSFFINAIGAMVISRAMIHFNIGAFFFI